MLQFLQSLSFVAFRHFQTSEKQTEDFIKSFINGKDEGLINMLLQVTRSAPAAKRENKPKRLQRFRFKNETKHHKLKIRLRLLQRKEDNQTYSLYAADRTCKYLITYLQQRPQAWENNSVEHTGGPGIKHAEFQCSL